MTLMTDDPYVRLVEVAIDREMDVIGRDRAVELARQVDGLSVTDDGEVERMDRPGLPVFEELIDGFKEASGEIAAFVVARRIENLTEERDVELPENLTRHL